LSYVLLHLVNKFFPDDAEIPKLNENEKESCEGMISEEECVKAIKSMQNSNIITYISTLYKTGLIFVNTFYKIIF
jgi:hypothetical protein